MSKSYTRKKCNRFYTKNSLLHIQFLRDKSENFGRKLFKIDYEKWNEILYLIKINFYNPL